MKVGILTVSDSCSSKQANDKSGLGIRCFLEQTNALQISEIDYEVIPDIKDNIKIHLERWISHNIDLIFTVGGTGCSIRDVTPEATREVIDKEVPGLSIAMLISSVGSVPMAMLSRSVCGIKNKTLIINLPGSQQGSLECLKVVLPVLGHAVDLIQDKKDSIKNTHIKLLEQHNQQDEKVYLSQIMKDHANQELQSVVVECNVAMRMRKSTFPVLDVDDALDIVLMESLVTEVESMPYDQCLHRIVARDVLAVSCLPPFDASIKDGYAVIASDGSGPRKVIGSVIAGSMLEIPLESGHCFRISTGAPVPCGADSVVQVEDTKLLLASKDGKEELEIEILIPPKPGQDIRPSGCDIGLKECILKAGMKIGPAEIGLLASAGNMKIHCFKLPSIGLLSTGNELVVPGNDLTGGNIRDCNKPMLMSALIENGFPVADLGIATDKADTLLSCLRTAFDSVDIIISTGGVSMGEKDLVKRILMEDLGAQIHFGQIFMKPGKPTTFATLCINGKKKYFFGLPGNPVSALVTFHLFVLPALRKMSGDPFPRPINIKARLSEQKNLDERPEYHRCALNWSLSIDGIPIASSTGNQLSSRLLSMRSAHGLLKLPPCTASSKILDKGCIVDCILLNKI